MSQPPASADQSTGVLEKETIVIPDEPTPQKKMDRESETYWPQDDPDHWSYYEDSQVTLHLLAVRGEVPKRFLNGDVPWSEEYANKAPPPPEQNFAVPGEEEAPPSKKRCLDEPNEEVQ